jgi:hypothetical protein
MTTSTAILNEKSIEERVHQSNRGGFAFTKGRYSIPLPQMLPYWITDHEKYLVTVASKLDQTLNKFYDLIGENNLYIRPSAPISGRNGIVRIHYCDTSHIAFLKDDYSENFVNSIGTKLHLTPKLIDINYNSDKRITVDITKRGFQTFTEPLLNIELDQALQAVEFDVLVENTIAAIDNLFIEQGIEPTNTNRHNLISLAVNLPTYNQQIQNLIEAGPQTHTIADPNLIRLASKGVKDDILKMFYAYDVYPENIEEMLELVDIPIEMLYGIWNGKR